MSSLDIAGAVGWIDSFAAAAKAGRDSLTELDRLSGDGDFGDNLASALGRASAALVESPPAAVADVFAAVSAAFLQTGGTSGPLFGMFFRDIARAAATRSELDLETVAAGVTAGLATVKRLGGASAGDKTMVDALEPAADALRSALATGSGVQAALREAAVAAHAGAEETAGLTARRGRASYVGESARGVLDPGAVAVGLFFETAPRERSYP